MTEYLSNKIRVCSLFAILLVFLQHAINFTGYIDPGTSLIGRANMNSVIQYFVGYGLARPAVYLFFLLSGYLFFRNFTLAKTFEKYRSRFRTLFIPYISWNLLALVFIIVLQLTPLTQTHISSFFTGYLPGRSLSEYVQIVLNHGVAFQLWFLYDLMLYALAAPIFYLAIRYGSIFLLLPLCYLWLFRIPLPWYLSFLDRGGLFYLAGAYIALHPLPHKDVSPKAIVLLTGFLWLLMLGIKTYIAFMPNGTSTYLAIIDNGAICLGILTIWSGYDVIANTRIIDALRTQTMFTFFIYAAHEPLLEILKYAGITLMGNSNLSLFASYFLVPIVTYLCCNLVAIYLKRYTVSFYNILTGGR
jgi:surface polysaccharide O-acyltransferase-like enzyme